MREVRDLCSGREICKAKHPFAYLFARICGNVLSRRKFMDTTTTPKAEEVFDFLVLFPQTSLW